MLRPTYYMRFITDSDWRGRRVNKFSTVSKLVYFLVIQISTLSIDEWNTFYQYRFSTVDSIYIPFVKRTYKKWLTLLWESCFFDFSCLIPCFVKIGSSVRQIFLETFDSRKQRPSFLLCLLDLYISTQRHGFWCLKQRLFHFL